MASHAGTARMEQFGVGVLTQWQGLRALAGVLTAIGSGAALAPSVVYTATPFVWETFLRPYGGVATAVPLMWRK